MVLGFELVLKCDKANMFCHRLVSSAFPSWFLRDGRCVWFRGEPDAIWECKRQHKVSQAYSMLERENSSVYRLFPRLRHRYCFSIRYAQLLLSLSPTGASNWVFRSGSEYSLGLIGVTIGMNS